VRRLDFAVDTSDTDARQRFDAAVASLAKPATKILMPGVEGVVMMAAGTVVGAGAYVKHADILVKGKGVKDQSLVEDNLCPALNQACGFECEAPIWWEDLADLKQDLEKHVSLFDRIRYAFQR